MGIGLMAPLFLAGLLAIAIPIFVHLMHKERKDAVPFPSLMFLRLVPFRSTRRQRIRYWLLFIMRSAALILIATAFARPWLSSPRVAARVAGGKDIVVLIDRSYSMSTRDVWKRAQSEAARVIGAAGANDRVAVAAFGERAQLVARFEDDRSAALTAVQALEPGYEVTRYAPPLRLAASLLAQSRGPAEIIWITDRQQNAARNLEPVETPPNTAVQVIDVRPSTVRNVGVARVALVSSTFAGRNRVTPTATVFNAQNVPASLAVDLRADGRVQQARTVRVAAGDSVSVEFTPMVSAATTGEVRIRGEDDVAADDVAYFAIAADAAPIVRVQAGNRPASFYFENALLAGDTGAFRIARSGARLTDGDLQSTDVLVLLESAIPQGAVGDRIKAFVEAGGGLIIAGASERTASDLVPVRNQDLVERRASPATIAAVDLSHAVFASFRANGTEPFGGARVLRYTTTRPISEASILARFDDGAPALVEHRLGRGRVLYWATGFSRSAGDFVLQPAFVPFIQQLVRYAAEPAQVTRTFTVGHVIAIDNFVPANVEAVISTPARKQIRLPSAEGPRTLRVEQPGVYQIHGDEADSKNELAVANVDATESDPAALDPTVLKQAVVPHAASSTAPATVAGITNLDDASRQSIWWYLLAAAFAVLAVETLIGNRISRQSRRPS